jgi:hypothetical protein
VALVSGLPAELELECTKSAVNGPSLSRGMCILCNQCIKSSKSNGYAFKQIIMEDQVISKTQDIHLILTKRSDFNKGQYPKMNLEW